MSSPTRADVTKLELLDASVHEFAAFGYRRTSMEAIARRAGLSRATVYLHWSSKEALFRDLVTQLHADRTTAMEAALAESGDVESRLIAMLRARYDRFVQLTASSPAAADLYDSHDRICGDISTAADTRARELVSALVRRATKDGEIDLRRVGISSDLLVDVLLGLGHAAKGTDPARSTLEAYEETLAATVRLVVRGLAPGPPARSN
ncbi:TetR/AcrR family transcriptional regulator [Nocardioides sp.]|uniref:TetR/AcrR family transcriptional regulator n=1 Tax=Nocardioides sp. TaxID=35761 RepID=UPI002B96EC6F|nr:TetR/AcrR family transcriptional regulator [Nocardioides sp.]HXH80103.1 TetR/AcrR family transcriptional regulator [Nocardioides sp.]